MKTDQGLEMLIYAARNNALIFKGRNILNIINKKIKKGQPYHFDETGMPSLLNLKP